MPQQEEAVRKVAGMIKGYVTDENILSFDTNLAGPAARIEKKCRKATEDPGPMKGLHDAHEYLMWHLRGNDEKQRVGLIRQALELLQHEAGGPRDTRRVRTESLGVEPTNLESYLGVRVGASR